MVYGLGINNMKNISNGGVLIECEKESDIFKLKKVMEEQVEEIKTSIPKKKNPKLIIKNIDASVSNKEIVDCIFKQNFQNQNAETLKDDVKVVFCTKEFKDHTKHAVIEVNSHWRKEILKLEKIKIKWNNCYINDFISITRCYKCLGFNHLAKYCQSKNENCSKCAGQHQHTNCPSEEIKCINCLKFNSKVKQTNKYYKTDHSVWDKNCPCYLYQRSNLISKTDYGN